MTVEILRPTRFPHRTRKGICPPPLLTRTWYGQTQEKDQSCNVLEIDFGIIIFSPQVIPAKSRVEFEALPLRRNVYYYRIYYVGLNTFFAAVLPLALLLFLNVRTAAELFKMGRADAERSPITIGQRKVTVR